MYIQQEKDGSILLTAPVMIPGVADCDYERGEPPLTRQQIQDFQKSYNKYRFIDHEHELTHNGITRGTPYKSYLLNKDTSFELYDGTSTVYPKGTWMLTSHITDPMAVQTALDGGYTGYSATVRSRTAADKYYNIIQKQEAKKSQSQAGLIKDIHDPVVLSVSLVKKPCQTASKLCKIKNDNGEIMSDETKLKTRILDAMGMSDAAEVESLKSQVASFEDTIEEIKKDNQNALNAMKEELIDEFKAALEEAFSSEKKTKDKEDTSEDIEDETEEDTSEDVSEDTSKEEDDEIKTQNEDKRKKGKSKAGHIHNAADKSTKTVNLYEIMGRNPDGTSKK